MTHPADSREDDADENLRRCYFDPTEDEEALRRVDLSKVKQLVRRRLRLCSQAPSCVCCRTKQVQLWDASMLAKWKCRQCKRVFVHEPIQTVISV